MTDADAVLAEIRRVVADELGVRANVTAQSDLLEELRLDSLGLLTLVVGLEDRFQVALEAGDAEHVRTAGELAALVARRAGGR